MAGGEGEGASPKGRPEGPSARPSPSGWKIVYHARYHEQAITPENCTAAVEACA